MNTISRAISIIFNSIPAGDFNLYFEGGNYEQWEFVPGVFSFLRGITILSLTQDDCNVHEDF